MAGTDKGGWQSCRRQNRQKSQYPFYNSLSTREHVQNQSHSQQQKKCKYLAINVTKDVKDFYNEYYKTLKHRRHHNM